MSRFLLKTYTSVLGFLLAPVIREAIEDVEMGGISQKCKLEKLEEDFESLCRKNNAYRMLGGGLIDMGGKRV